MLPPPLLSDRRRALLALLGGATAPAARAQAPALARNGLLVGQVLTLDGGRNEQGVALRQGVEAAWQVIQANGGIDGRPLSIRVLDDQGRADLAQAQAHRLLDDGALLLFGPLGDGPCGAVQAVAQARGVPLFAPVAGLPALRQPHQPLVFPVRAALADEFRALLAHGASLGMRRAMLLQDDSEVGRQHLAAAQAQAATLGLAPLQPLLLPAAAGEVTLQQALDRLHEQRVDLVFNHGQVGPYERLLRLARARRGGPAFWAVSLGATPLLRQLGEQAGGMVVSQVVPSPWDGRTQLGREYQAAFRASFRDQPLSQLSLEGYLNTRALALALALAGRQPTPERFLAGLADAQLDVAGQVLSYRRGEHLGSRLVTLALVQRDGKLLH
jgi:branched-chain amino acid transport system substrate-binding protein